MEEAKTVKPLKTVRAKFTCNKITEDHYAKMVEFSAVHFLETEGENKDFTEATPYGELKIQIERTAPAANYFEVGKNYYLDFSKAE